VLMFTRSERGGRGSQIWSVDATGRNERRVASPGAASDPAWSPLIQ
jgi:TolB protein